MTTFDGHAVRADAGDWRGWFCLAFAFYLGVTLWSQGAWLASGGMWAEMASNYYPNAHAPSWMVRLFATDAGYWPMPQRLIALAEGLVGLPVGAVPFYYGGAAVLLGGVLVAGFCHPVFRVLVADDRVRCAFCLLAGVIPDFETRTFINFTYLGLFLAVPLVSLALVRPAVAAPGWAWVLPLLMVSKPQFLTLVPAMAVAAVVSRGRFRRVLVVGLCCAAAQLGRLAISDPAGDHAENFTDPSRSVVSRLFTAVGSGAGLLGDYVMGPELGLRLGEVSIWLVVGAGLVMTAGVLLFWLRRWRMPTAALMLVGLSVVYAVALLNSFALSATWTVRFRAVEQFQTTRATLGAIAGTLMVVAALAELVLGRVRPGRPLFRFAPLVVSLGWMAASGWGYVVNRAFPGGFPVTGSSHWMVAAGPIGAGTRPICVPVDPYRHLGPMFMYRDGCAQLNNGPAPDGPAQLATAAAAVVPPALAQERRLAGMMVVVRPERDDTAVTVEATATLPDGGLRRYAGRQVVGKRGGTVLLLPLDGPAPVRAVRLTTSPPVPVVSDGSGMPGIIYLGEVP